MNKELLQNVVSEVIRTVEDYVEFDYSRGQQEYIIINVVELVKEQFNSVVNTEFVQEIKDIFTNQKIYKSTIENLESINAELKINLY